MPPTRSNCFSSSARRIFACSDSGSSPISSRNSVPRCASSNLPGLRAAAPVNAPFSWPKSSVSSRFSGIAAQLMATNGPSARGLSACSARANSSLPVPLSPSSSTVVSVAGRALQRDRHLLQPRILADDLRRAAARGELLLEQDVLGRQPALRERALDHQQQMIGIDRLGEKVERAFLHRRDGVLDAAEGRHHDDGQFGIELLGGAQHAEAVAVRQPEVGQHDAGTRALQRGDGLGLVARFDDGVALRLERVAQHRAQRVLVLDEQDRRIGRARARALTAASRQGRRPCALLRRGRRWPSCPSCDALASGDRVRRAPSGDRGRCTARWAGSSRLTKSVVRAR